MLAMSRASYYPPISVPRADFARIWRKPELGGWGNSKEELVLPNVLNHGIAFVCFHVPPRRLNV